MSYKKKSNRCLCVLIIAKVLLLLFFWVTGNKYLAVIRISNSDRFVIEFIEENHKLVIIIDIETSSAVNSTHLDFMRCTDKTHREPCVVCERNM